MYTKLVHVRLQYTIYMCEYWVGSGVHLQVEVTYFPTKLIQNGYNEIHRVCSLRY